MPSPLQCPGNRICCPVCGKPTLSGLSAHEGRGFLHCERRSATGEQRYCNTHFYWHCTARLCSTLEVSKALYMRLDNEQCTHEEVLAAIGVELMPGSEWPEAA